MIGFGTLTVTFGLGTLIVGFGTLTTGLGMLMTGLGISTALVLVVVTENRIMKPATMPKYLPTAPSNQK